MKQLADHVFLTLIVGLILTGMACGLFGGGASTPPTPSLATVACVVRYQGCAAALVPDASTMADYLACRGAVDRDCMTTDAGGQ